MGKIKAFVGREQLKGHLDMLVLSAIANGPAHGYAVIAHLAEASDGVFDLPEGTVYPALHRLEKSGLLKSYWERGETTKRRVYEITAEGRRALREQKATWRDFAAAMETILTGAKGVYA